MHIFGSAVEVGRLNPPVRNRTRHHARHPLDKLTAQSSRVKRHRPLRGRCSLSSLLLILVGQPIMPGRLFLKKPSGFQGVNGTPQCRAQLRS
jgi:hypothetical protein